MCCFRLTLNKININLELIITRNMSLYKIHWYIVNVRYWNTDLNFNISKSYNSQHIKIKQFEFSSLFHNIFFLLVMKKTCMQESIQTLTITHNQTYTISYDKSPLCVKNTYICCLLFLSAQRCQQIELLLTYSPPMNNKNNNSRHRKVKVCRQQNDGQLKPKIIKEGNGNVSKKEASRLKCTLAKNGFIAQRKRFFYNS